MATSIRERAYEIGRTTIYNETDAKVAAAMICEDYPDQAAAICVLDSVVCLAGVRHQSLSGMTIELLPFLRGEVITI